jgi:hypothetical protein
MADEKCRADFPLQLQDLLAQRWLRDAEMGRSFREMQMFGNGKKVSQLAQFHIFFVSK